MLESKKIMVSNSNIDIMGTFKNIEHYEITYADYNPLEPQKNTESSRLKVEGNAGSTFFLIQASGNNCTQLWEIAEKCILPNLVEILEIDEGEQ